ncbi:MAG TPA: AraC family ligand binding domain-containing protein, partial [Rhodopila sp.]|uniref:AraC family ligand binding domain-containing protein n=1 Tax=Rhodopila sp. TaxID=2480087 RepID=UPI002BE715D0
MQTVPDATPASPRLIPIAKDARAFSRGRHSHPWAHLIYATSGVVSVTTEAGTWVVPPNRAIWVPAGVEHATRSHGPVRFRAFIVESGANVDLPAACCVMEMSELARALILRLDATLFPARPNDFTERAARLLLDELGALPTQPLRLPMPRNPQFAKLCISL